MKIKSFITLATFAAGSASLSAQSLESASESIQADLDAALEQYAALLEEIGGEKVPLANELNDLEAKVTTKRREVTRAQRLADNAGSSVSQLETEIESREKSINYMSNTLNEYVRQFEISIDIAEKQLYSEMIETVLDNIENEEISSEEKFDAQFEIVETGLARVEDVLGGKKFNGSAIIPGGESKDGSFVVLGPVSVFAAADGSSAGMVSLKDPVRAKIVEVEGGEGIASLVNSGSGTIVFDPTLNDALELDKAKVTIIDQVEAGGIWVWPIIISFFLSMLIGVFKFFEIYSIRTPKETDLQQTLQYLADGQDADAAKYARGISGPFGKLFQDAVKHAKSSKELLEEVLYERMLETQPQVERLLPIIAVTAATAPLLGLLGTVTGMINTFQQITLFGTSDASKLAGGISEALITTMFGLIAAIPSLVVHALLARRAQGILAAMEKYSAAFINGLESSKK
ncbi:MAG: MotA/TolQ/ExbB proton channel family protein [Opitutales bacterium]